MNDNDNDNGGMDDVIDYFGEDVAEPLQRAIDSRIEAAAAKPEQPAQQQPVEPSAIEANDDAVLDHILDGNYSEAEAMRQQSTTNRREGTVG